MQTGRHPVKVATPTQAGSCASPGPAAYAPPVARLGPTTATAFCAGIAILYFSFFRFLRLLELQIGLWRLRGLPHLHLSGPSVFYQATCSQLGAILSNAPP